MPLPLEDTVVDVLAKAQRGLAISDSTLAAGAGISESALAGLQAGVFDADAVSKVAAVLGLNGPALIALGSGSYRPREIALRGLEIFTSPFGDMTVNSFLAWDRSSREAVAFDTGADATEMLNFLEAQALTLRLLLITHTHGDHIFELDRLVEKTGAIAFVGDREPRLAGTRAFSAGQEFSLGRLTIHTRLTWGHAQGGITYVVSGMEKLLAVVGDAVFAGSMGGGMVSYADALRTNRTEIMTLEEDTILACGHGPLTTVQEQKIFNPFLAL